MRRPPIPIFQTCLAFQASGTGQRPERYLASAETLHLKAAGLLVGSQPRLARQAATDGSTLSNLSTQDSLELAYLERHAWRREPRGFSLTTP